MEKQKMSVLAELKNLTSERYVVSIDADTTVYEDDYEEGEGDYVNMWKNKEIHLTTTSDELSVDLSKALKEYIEDELNIDYDKVNIKQLFDDSDDEQKEFWLSRMVDVDNDDVSQTQIELWKKGEEKLYVQSIGMNVKINGTPINCGMLKKLIFSTENA